MKICSWILPSLLGGSFLCFNRLLVRWWFDQRLNCRLDSVGIRGWGKALANGAGLIYQEFGEIPFDCFGAQDTGTL